MEPYAAKGQKTLFDFGCTKRKRTEADERSLTKPRELCTRLEPILAIPTTLELWWTAALRTPQPARQPATGQG
eukprot:931841-Pelagomonas_calceolata.AAC.3